MASQQPVATPRRNEVQPREESAAWSRYCCMFRVGLKGNRCPSGVERLAVKKRSGALVLSKEHVCVWIWRTVSRLMDDNDSVDSPSVCHMCSFGVFWKSIHVLVSRLPSICPNRFGTRLFLAVCSNDSGMILGLARKCSVVETVIYPNTSDTSGERPDLAKLLKHKNRIIKTSEDGKLFGDSGNPKYPITNWHLLGLARICIFTGRKPNTEHEIRSGAATTTREASRFLRRGRKPHKRGSCGEQIGRYWVRYSWDSGMLASAAL